MSAVDGLIAGYLELLERYHRTLDLLSAQGLDQLGRLVDDAKAYAAAIATHATARAPTVVDVGSGAGLPGIVVALSLPDARVYLVERRRRRAAFLQLVTGRLSIPNATVVNSDVRHLSGVCADAVTAQAVAGLTEVARLTRHLQADPCLLISRRGPGWEADLPELRSYIAGSSHAAGPDSPEPLLGATARSADTAFAGNDAAVAVLAAEALEQRGSLVTLRLAGGPACRSSA